MTPLSYVAAALCGERDVLWRGRRMQAREALAEAGIQPPSLQPKEGLAIMNGTAVMTALACLAWRQILIVGVGTSIPIVQGMYSMLMRLGLNCKAQTDSYLQLMEVALLGPDDVVVGISQSGSSKDPVYTLKQAKANGVSTICITGNAQSPITQYADVTLLSVAREARIEAIASRIAQMSIADALYIIVALNNIDAAIQNEKLIWDALLPKMF